MIKEISKKILLICLSLSSYAWADLTLDQKRSRDQGLALYQQSDWYESQNPLKNAAIAGDQESQYYLGEALRLSNRFMTAEAARWYIAAAKQGNLYAMLRLSNTQDLCTFLTDCAHDTTEWREKLIEQGREQAEQGDTSAMIALYMAGQGLDWLEKAANSNDHYAQYLLAELYSDGNGWFLTPGKREETIKELLKASAEGGYPPSMLSYIRYFSEEGNHAEVRKWIIKAAQSGHIDAVYSYAAHSAQLPESFGFEKDYIKGYGLFYLLSELNGGGIAPEYAKQKIAELNSIVSPDQIKKAIEFANTWKSTHPPLSYFVPVYGF